MATLTIPCLQFFSARRKPNKFRTEGDSYCDGAYNVALKFSLRNLQSRWAVNSAIGGTDPSTQGPRLSDPANAPLRSMTTIFWDGSPNNMAALGGVGPYCDLIASGLAALGHNRFVLIQAAAGGVVGSVDDSNTVLAEYLRRWPNNTLDWRPFIPNTGGLINSDQFNAADPGPAHLSQAAMDAFVTNGLLPFIAAKGW